MWLKNILSFWLDFGPDYTKSQMDNRTGEVYSKHVVKTRIDEQLTKLHDLWYDGRRRIVPIEFIEKHFTDLSLAIWYLDDGTLTTAKGYYRIVFGTNRYSKEEVEFLAELLRSRYTLKVHVTPWQNGKFVLRMFQGESRKLLKIINNVLPTKLRCMSYKLEEVGKYGA